MDTENLAPGGEAVTVVPVPSPAPAETAPVNASEAARQLAQWRVQKKQNEAKETQAAPAEAAAETNPAEGQDSDPPAEAPAEATEAPDPAEELPPIEAPRSWTKDEKERFQSLPRETQEYIAQREQEREREIRRSQNEAAEERKATKAERDKVEQARQQYETALPVVLQTLQQTLAGEFSDIKTLQDAEKLAADDWPKYLRWRAHQDKVAGFVNEIRANEERRAQEDAAKFSDFAKEQDKLFIERVPEFADKDKAAKLQKLAADYLVEVGFSDGELPNYWHGQDKLSLRDARMQEIIADAARYRAAKATAAKPAPKPVPPVQRPGVAKDHGAAKVAQIEAAAQKLSTARGNSALAAATELLRAQRTAAKR